MAHSSCRDSAPGSRCLRNRGASKDASGDRLRAAALSFQLLLHISANGYAAGYYAYLWSEMLDDDAYQWFEEHGG